MITISTPFDALLYQVLHKIQFELGITYDPSELKVVRIPTTNPFFAAIECYTTDTADDVRVHVYLQNGDDDASTPFVLDNQGQFYCPESSPLYPEYGPGTKVYTYVRTIVPDLVMEYLNDLPTACAQAGMILATESGQPILQENSNYISIS